MHGTPIAHSVPENGTEPDSYARHVRAVVAGACERASTMLGYASHPGDLLDSVRAAATFHDLGKLDPANQAELRKGRGGQLPWDHIDGGVAHLSNNGDWPAAWLVRSHHAPGLPDRHGHFPDGPRLRGRRKDDKHAHRVKPRHDEQIRRTDERLQQYVDDHQAAVGAYPIAARGATYGMTMRLALSCLVDADYSDTAFFDTGLTPDAALPARWDERLENLREYVRKLPAGADSSERERNMLRSSFFEACLGAPIVDRMAACEGPVGLGKTTAVTAYLLRRACEEMPRLRRLIVVAPYTNILKQTADRLRQALTLSGEDPQRVVVEHNHRADFQRRGSREFAALWQAPIVLTTAVSFFETLAGCTPGALRKLHALPGSAVFIDEAHAALPTSLWPQNWKWLCELAANWGCRFVFASGSLVRFWSDERIIQPAVTLPELLPAAQRTSVGEAERRRVRYVMVDHGKVIAVERLVALARAEPGPRLVILNTVQSAAVVARAMRAAGVETYHLSTALTPRDRGRMLDRVVTRLKRPGDNWVLVATSCVEAGVDLSFRCAFRERFATTSTLQVAGRTNRHGEYNSVGGGLVYDFAVAGPGITAHPAAKTSADVLRDFLDADALNSGHPSEVATNAMAEELSRSTTKDRNELVEAERERSFAAVAKLGRVIATDTCLVVVDDALKRLIRNWEPVPFKDLLDGSVQLWTTRVAALGLPKLRDEDQFFEWNAKYDGQFLGVMEGLLDTEAFKAHGSIV